MNSGKYASWEIKVLQDMAARAEREAAEPIAVQKPDANDRKRERTYLLSQGFLILLGALAAGLVAYLFTL